MRYPRGKKKKKEARKKKQQRVFYMPGRASQLGFDVAGGCAGLLVDHHIAALIAVAEEDDLDRQIIPVSCELE